MKGENGKLIKSDELTDSTKLEGLDAIFTKVSQSATYPVILNTLSAGLSWGAGGMLIFMGNILAAAPDKVTCDSFTSENVTFDQCKHECPGNKTFEFYGDWTDETIVTRYELYCDRANIVNDMNTINLTGMLVGGLLFGNLSDIFGRRIVMISTMLLAGVVGIATIFLAQINLYAFAIGRFLVSCLIHGSNIVQFVYGMEQSSPTNRAILGILTQLYFSGGYMALSVFGYLFQNWQHMGYAMSAFPLLSIFFVTFLPESYRWYFGQRRRTEGINHIKKYAKHCGSELDDAFIGDIINQYELNRADSADDEAKKRVYNVHDLFRTPRIRAITLKMMVVYVVTTMVYYALFLVKLPGGLLLNNVIMGAMEFFVMFPTAAIMNRSWCNRSRVVGAMWWTLSLSLFGCAVALYFSTEEGDVGSEIMRFLSLFGCAVIAAEFVIIFVWVGEIYPTVIRNCSLGLLSTTGRIGAILAPQIMKLTVAPISLPWLPYIIFGTLCVIAGCSSFSLPDTNGKKFIQSIEEAEKQYS